MLSSDRIMHKSFVHILSPLLLLSAVLFSCSSGGVSTQAEESRQAKQLLQGVWTDDDTESVVFKMEGDSVYYPDSTSMTAYFKVVGDTLYIGSARYHIKKQTEHLLWFQSQDGSLVKLAKDDGGGSDEVFAENRPQIQQLSGVLKRDTVVFHDGRKYHLYIAINPTKYKVSRTTVNEDGLSVENVYYDNIIHLSVFQNARQLFSRDFRKQYYARLLPANITTMSILNDMAFERVDAGGFHLNASLCIPGDASCYLVEQVVGFDGRLTSKLAEY